MKKTAMIVLIAVSAVLGVSFHVGAVDQKDPRALFEDACSRCHSLDLPRGEKLTKAGWQGIVKRMLSNGLDVTDQEAAIIVDYLSANYAK